MLMSGGACDCAGGDSIDTFTPDLRVAPVAIDFGAWPVGARAERQITLINDGNAPVELLGAPSLTSTAESGFTLEPHDDVFPLAGGTVSELRVLFAPSVEGRFEGTLVLPCAPPVGVVEIPIAGEGKPAEVELSPPVLDFGELAAGESATATLTLTSRSDVALSLPLAIEGAGFLLEGRPRRTVSLEPLGSASFTVTFTPFRGGPFEGRAVAEVCGEGCGPSSSLRGEGLAPRLAIRPRPVDLGEVPVGDVARETIVLENVGVGTLSVRALQVLDDGGRVTLEDVPSLPAVLEAEEQLTLKVRYEASVPEAEVAASLVVESNDPLSPRVNVPIFASTPGSALRVVPGAAHFGVLYEGDSRELEVIVLSSGTAPVTLTGAALVDDATGSFELLTPLPSLPYVMQPADSLLLTLRASPRSAAVDAGGASATLVFSTEEAGEVESALTFASGTEGCQPRAPRSSLNLGAVRVGLGASGFLEVENVGNGVCTLASLGPTPGLPFASGFTWTDEDLDELLPGSSGIVNVGFVPSAPGTSSAYFTLRFVEQPAPLFVSATGWGVLGSLVAEPPSVHFGPNIEGCPAPSGVVAYVNDGAGPVTVNGVALDPPDGAFDIENIAPRVVPAGGTLEVDVTPHTDSAGTFTARLVADTEESGEVSALLSSVVEPPGSPVTEHFEVEASVQRIDVLFIIDDSGSMADDQEVLAANFERFIAEADRVGHVDFHIGVTTTDVISPDAARGRLIGTPKVLTPTTPNLEGAFASRARVGVQGHGLELGLEAMRLALSEPLLSSHNAGFYRPDAALSVIVVTDEDDSGDYPYLTEYYPEGTRSVEGYISFLAALKGGQLQNAPVLFSAVSLYAPRYGELVRRFGGVQLDLAGDWGSQLGALGHATFGLGRSFRLGAPPQPGSVVVTVDGQPTEAFTVDASVGLVLLDEPPAPGAQVSITYLPVCS